MTTRESPHSDHRLFLSEVDQSLDCATLSKEIINFFQTYGTVVKVFLPDQSSKAYAFVNLESPEAAQRALKELSLSAPHKLFQGIRPAHVIRNKNKAQKYKKRVTIKWKHKFDVAIQSNVICQLHCSHVKRLINFLKHSDTIIHGDWVHPFNSQDGFVGLCACQEPYRVCQVA
jgi:RNA recognition motif-containing protein